MILRNERTLKETCEVLARLEEARNIKAVCFFYSIVEEYPNEMSNFQICLPTT